MQAIQTGSPLKVTRVEIIRRGLTQRCPNCGRASLFEDGRYFAMRAACPECGMQWDKDEAAFLGSTALNYGVTVFGFILPTIVVGYFRDVSMSWLIAITAVGALVLPAVFYRASKSAWFLCYYWVMPTHLPANWPARDAADRPPDE